MAHMSYTKNPYLPKLRMQAARKVLYEGWGLRQVARHYGVSPGAVHVWVQRASQYAGYTRHIPTESSRPHTHPHALDAHIVDRIVTIRSKRGRCAEVIHQQMLEEGYSVSLSSVKRTLDRKGLTNKRSPYKRYHPPSERPKAFVAGDLVELDTIHSFIYTSRVKFFVYTLLDVYSRWAWAEVAERINTHASVEFVQAAQQKASFPFLNLQSDHGSEFSTSFTDRVGIRHRHIHVRSPNEKGHLERFNRTIQEECLNKVSRTPEAYRRVLPEYLYYYNHERMHMGINFKRPIELTKCSQGIE